ncbi:hypothetical protein AB3R30_00635 [Leptolyngbyaceae cyanobacterium UHCC 1019]
MVGLSYRQIKTVWERIFSEQFLSQLSKYCHSSYYYIRHNPKLFIMRKISRIEILRDLMAWFYQITGKSYEIRPVDCSNIQPIDIDAVVTAIHENGYYSGIELSADRVQEILDYAQTALGLGDREPTLRFCLADKPAVEAKLGKQFMVCSYPTQDCAAVNQVIHDPKLLAIAAKFLGASPICIGSELLWSFPAPSTLKEQTNQAQVFHYDLDDYRSIKFFFYINAVDASGGPHVCIAGTHRYKTLLHQLLGQRCAAIPDQQLIAQYGSENVITFCGEAGFGFAEDPCCFHKASPPDENVRLLLQVQYAINHYGDIRAFNG